MDNILTQNLRNANLKITPQRMAIYSFLASTNEHPSAETIYNAIKEDNPSMSLATVYKNVAILRDAHLITEFNIGEDSHRYDANINYHTHLVCRCCHNIYDYFDEISLNSVVNNIKDNLGFLSEDHKLVFYGICKNCHDKLNN